MKEGMVGMLVNPRRDAADKLNFNPFSWKGRIDRAGYFLFGLIPSAIANGLFVHIEKEQNKPDYALLSLLMIVLIGLPSFYLWVVNAIKRCHDLRMSGYYVLWFVVPIVGAAAGLYLLFRQSTWRPVGDDRTGRIRCFRCQANIDFVGSECTDTKKCPSCGTKNVLPGEIVEVVSPSAQPQTSHPSAQSSVR